MRWFRFNGWYWVLFVLWIPVRASSDSLLSKVEGTQVTTTQLGYRILDFVSGFSGEVEQTADQIAERTTNSVTKKNALLWKVNAVPALQRAALQTDVVASLLDVWTLCAQMEQFFEKGAGKNLFGGNQALAIETSRLLLGEIKRIASGVLASGDISEPEKVINQWVKRYPIDSLLFTRASILQLISKYMDEGGASLFAVAGVLQEDIADLRARLTVYIHHMPKQARWEAALFLMEATAPMLDQVNRSVSGFANDQRVAILEDVRKERAVILAEVKDIASATVDRAFAKAAQFLGLLLLATATGIAIFFGFRKKQVLKHAQQQTPTFQE